MCIPQQVGSGSLRLVKWFGLVASGLPHLPVVFHIFLQILANYLKKCEENWKCRRFVPQRHSQHVLKSAAFTLNLNFLHFWFELYFSQFQYSSESTTTVFVDNCHCHFCSNSSNILMTKGVTSRFSHWLGKKGNTLFYLTVDGCEVLIN